MNTDTEEMTAIMTASSLFFYWDQRDSQIKIGPLLMFIDQLGPLQK